jgi:hypothetical protein
LGRKRYNRVVRKLRQPGEVFEQLPLKTAEYGDFWKKSAFCKTCSITNRVSEQVQYFKLLSNVFHEIECGRKPSNEMIENLEKASVESEKIIRDSDTRNIFDSYINETFIRSMISRDAALRGKFYNWLIVFNWKEGKFENWQVIEWKANDAIRKYSDMEKKWNAEDGYEVVMIGSSDVSTIRKTHSHYFGIESYDTILQSIDDTLLSFRKRNDFDHDARIVLQCMYRRGNWNTKKVSYDTLKTTIVER